MLLSVAMVKYLLILKVPYFTECDIPFLFKGLGKDKDSKDGKKDDDKKNNKDKG